jgi:hypothetical protein
VSLVVLAQCAILEGHSKEYLSSAVLDLRMMESAGGALLEVHHRKVLTMALAQRTKFFTLARFALWVFRRAFEFEEELIHVEMAAS